MTMRRTLAALRLPVSPLTRLGATAEAVPPYAIVNRALCILHFLLMVVFCEMWIKSGRKGCNVSCDAKNYISLQKV